MINEIWNNNFDNVEFGTESTKQTTLQIDPAVADQYDELNGNMDELFIKRKMWDDMLVFYENSPFMEKYGKEYKKIERCDFFELYYYFKEKLASTNEYNIVQIFCGIAEFFDLNYRTLYNDIISLEDKVEILDTLQEDFGLKKKFLNVNKLF